jgi:hypothetical protein
MTFSNFSSSLNATQGNADNDSITVSGSLGAVTLTQGTGNGDAITIQSGGNMSLFAAGNEFGLSFPVAPPLYISAITGDTGSVDLHWAFDVTAASIADAFLAFDTDLAAGVGGNAQASVTMTLNGVPVVLNAPGSLTTTFAPATSLHVDIHEINTQSGPSTVTFRGLTAAFSPAAVPEPPTLALLALSIVGLAALRRRKLD